MTRLTPAERETTITMSDANDVALVITNQRPVARRLRHLTSRYPGTVVVTRDERNAHGQPTVEAELPVKFIGIRPSRHKAFRTAPEPPAPRPDPGHADLGSGEHESEARTT